MSGCIYYICSLFYLSESVPLLPIYLDNLANFMACSSVQFTTIGDLIGPFGEFDGTFNVSTPKRPSVLTQNATGSPFTFAQDAYYKRT
jgi:hypothetical protein